MYKIIYENKQIIKIIPLNYVGSAKVPEYGCKSFINV